MEHVIKKSYLHDEDRADLDLACDALQHMNQVTNDVLDISKLQAGHIETETQSIDIRATAANTVTQYERSARRTIKLIVEASVPAFVVVDGFRLKQVLSNGLSNALKHVSGEYVREDGQAVGGIRVNVIWVHPNKLRIEVRNSFEAGRGLRGVDAGRLFDPFAAAGGGKHASRTSGTGLGLAIVRLIAKGVLKGDAGLYDDFGSELAGIPRETVFWCEFPVELPKPSKSPRSVAANSMVSYGSAISNEATGDASADESDGPILPMHVLIVDDERVNRLVLGRMVERLGLTCDFAEDGDEVDIDSIARDSKLAVSAGWEAADRAAQAEGRRAYGALLLDIRMPRLQGDEVCRRLRAAGCRLPVYATTANASVSDLKRYSDVGFTPPTLTKPFTIDDVKARLVQASKWGRRLSSASTDIVNTGAGRRKVSSESLESTNNVRPAEASKYPSSGGLPLETIPPTPDTALTTPHRLVTPHTTEPHAGLGMG